VISEILTFVIFVMIGLEIRNGLSHPKAVILPMLCALSGMVFPALIFDLFGTHSSAWAVAMPTDVALAVGALSILGKRINPAPSPVVVSFSHPLLAVPALILIARGEFPLTGCN